MSNNSHSPENGPIGGFLTNTFGEQYLHVVNRESFNAIGSEAVFQRHLPANLWEEDRLHIIIGTDSGLLVEHVNRHGIPDGSRFLFIELEDVLEAVEGRLAHSPLDPRIVLANPEAWRQQAQDLDLDSYVYLDRLQLLQSVGASDAYQPRYRDLHTSVKGDLDSWVWALRSQLASSDFIHCQLANIAENRLPAAHFKNAFPGKTAVLLAGGPSLDDMLPWIKAHRESLIVVAVSRVSRRLLQENLQPDIVCTIDPTTLSFDVSKEMLDFDPDVILIQAYHTYPPLVTQWRGPSVYLGERYPWCPHEQYGNIPTDGPTVSNTAIRVLVELGVSQIVLAGLDLCFKSDGVRYASGSNESQVGPALGHMGQRVETNAGNMADTISDFLQSMHAVGKQAAMANERGCRIINPAPDAAKIPNVTHQPVASITLSKLETSPRQTLAALLPPNDKSHRLAHYHKVGQELERTVIQLEKIKILASEAIRCNDGLFGRNGIKQNFKYKIKMDKIEKRLDKEFSHLGQLVKNYGIRQFLRMLRPDRDKEWQDEEIETSGRVYYESYRDGAQRLLEKLHEAQRLIDIRIEEENPVPDIDSLISHWREHDEPGRALVWQQLHPEQNAALDITAQQAMHSLAELFRATLAETDTRHMKRCRAEASLDSVPSKAALLLKQRDIIGLRRLAEGLQDAKGQDTTPLSHFVRGCLAEAETDIDTALAHYQGVVEGPLLEDALRRICSLSMEKNDYQSTLLALQCLSHISPGYMPQYAEFLRIIGQVKEAADVYNQYLEKVPDDLSAILNLGKLYLQQNILDGARWAFNYALEKTPGNQAAKQLLESLDEAQGHSA